MGQGYSLTTLSAGSAGIDVPELSDLAYERNLGDARFMKAVRARHRNGMVVAKIVMKPYATMKFGKYIDHILWETKRLFDIPNAIGYHRAFETSSNGYLVRQYIYSSIYDRLSTRPFLEDIEKRWLAFQLLSAVRDCHANGVYHGDIKTENTLVTSWNWLYLSDFSSAFKPTYLPEDNPAEFSFYFDTSGRRTCYLAPERFLGAGETSDAGGNITWAMDIFSVGCVIAEIFLESPTFNLSQLFKYRSGENDPGTAHLNRVEDQDIRELILHMIQLQPESRYSADEYLNFWRRKAFPDYFYSFLHQYMDTITDPTSGKSTSRKTEELNNAESDDRIDRMYNDFDKIAYFLGHDNSETNDIAATAMKLGSSSLPHSLDATNRRRSATATMVLKDDGTLLFLNIATSALRTTARATTRVRACEIMLMFSQRLTDEAKLDRVLPYILVLVQDVSDLVKVTALRSLAQLLAMVALTSPINAYLFPEYILPRLEAFSPPASRKQNSVVRETYALCVASIAKSAARFLDMIQSLKSEGAITSGNPNLASESFSNAYEDIYDAARSDLIKHFERQTKALLTDSNGDVRRAFLSSVSSLCVFFGSARANDVILSHLNTYLNDRDWRLRCSFFETIVGVAIYVGGTNLEEFILPLMAQALTDPEETVVEKVLRSLATMAHLGLLQRQRTWELVDLVARFMCHPNAWIREAAAHFISTSTKHLSVADCECIMKPLVRPLLRLSNRGFEGEELLDALKRPLPRQVLDMAMMWAARTANATFWHPCQTRPFAPFSDERVKVESSVQMTHNALSRTFKTDEDQQWLGRLRNCGMTADDEIKLIALRDYIWRSARQKTPEPAESANHRFNRIQNVSSLGVGLDTVFFDQEHFINDSLSQATNGAKESDDPQTITDALLDASTTIDDSARRVSVEGDGVTTSSGPRYRSQQTTIAEAFSRTRSPLTNVSQSPETAVAESILTTQIDNQHGLGKPSLERMQPSQPPTPSPFDKDRPTYPNEPLQRKSSVMDLMQRKTFASKAGAATSTTSASAVGRNDVDYLGRDPTSITRFNAMRAQKESSPDERPFPGAHNYTGRDPNVLKLLDTVYLDSFPMDNVDFGPLVTPLDKRQAEGEAGVISTRRWKPSGSLVAVFGEHSGPINRILPSPDHLFFITASDDGSVRVWDCSRLEQNLTHRSKQVYRHGMASKVNSICFVTETHCFVSAGSDGVVHVVRVDCVQTSRGSLKYGKLKTLRQWRLPDENAPVVWMEHFRSESQSMLFIATANCKVIALDLRSMQLLYTLHNPVQHGTPTSFCIGQNHLWLLLGTSHGCLDLWDLRFRVRLKGWRMPTTTPVHRVYLHPAPPEKPAEGREQGPKKLQKLVCVAGGTELGEVTVWDLETGSCAGAFRTSAASSPAEEAKRQESIRTYALTDLDAEPRSSMLSQLAASKPLEAPNNQEPRQQAVRAMAVGNLSSTASGAPAESYFLTGDTDLNVTLWDLDRIERSCIVNGPGASHSDKEGRFVFRRADKSGLLPVFEQRLEGYSHREADEPESSSRASDGGRGRANVGAKRSGTPSVAGSSDQAAESQVNQEAASRREGQRSSMVNEQQQKLLKSHLDMVLDVAILEYPKKMVVSVDRSGAIFVFS